MSDLIILIQIIWAIMALIAGYLLGKHSYKVPSSVAKDFEQMDKETSKKYLD